MEENPRCKKCSRALKSPISIARGMSPKCVGVSAASGKVLAPELGRIPEGHIRAHVQITHKRLFFLGIHQRSP